MIGVAIVTVVHGVMTDNQKLPKHLPDAWFPEAQDELRSPDDRQLVSLAQDADQSLPPTLQTTAPPTTDSQNTHADPEATPAAQPSALASALKTSRIYLPKVLKKLSATRWQVMILLGVVTTGTVAAALLFRLPALPNCPAIFWPFASASLRLYCAQVAANKQTVNDLLEAISLVNSLPANHPLRPEINRYLEQWSLDLLELAERTFHEGRLAEAITIATKIPNNTPAFKQVTEKTQRWQKIWSNAERIYQDAEAELRKENWRLAFRIAVELLTVGNNHWETTRFEELNRAIKISREDSTKLAKAKDRAGLGGVENLLAAIKLAQEIAPNSYVYANASKAIADFSNKVFDLAQARLDAQDFQGALEIAQQIPNVGDLEQKVQDFMYLAQAQQQAWGGTVADVEAAILTAGQVSANRPLYAQAQELISNWQLELQAIPILELAQKTATMGGIKNLTAAIAQAQEIPSTNPLWQKTERFINNWTREVQTIEDRPYLDRAQELAIAGDIPSLQAAIDTAAQIRGGRALSAQAQTNIRNWTQQLQRLQDQPLLSQAEDWASRGDLSAAVRTAEQIQSGRTLYPEAQSRIQSWQLEIRGRQTVAKAQQIASSGTLESLTSAMQTADQVPSGSSWRPQANALIDDWSGRLLRMAEDTASSDLGRAIAIARKIPSNASVYPSAQQQIQAWRESLNPPAPMPTIIRETPTPVPSPTSTETPVAPLPSPSP